VIINAGICRVIVPASPRGFNYQDVDDWITEERFLSL
jgi:hypothetical protein